MTKECTPEQFVMAWQESNSVAEVSEKTGIPTATASGRARDYRVHGIPLKMMHKAGKRLLDVKALTKLAKKTENKKP